MTEQSRAKHRGSDGRFAVRDPEGPHQAILVDNQSGILDDGGELKNREANWTDRVRDKRDRQAEALAPTAAQPPAGLLGGRPPGTSRPAVGLSPPDPSHIFGFELHR